MNAQGWRQHTWSQAQMVIKPVGWAGVTALTWDVGTYPDSDIRCHIKGPCSRIRLVFIDRRRPVDGIAAQNQPKKEWNVQPMAAAHQNMVPLCHEHAWLYQ